MKTYKIETEIETKIDLDSKLTPIQRKFFQSDKKFKIWNDDFDSGKSYAAFMNIFRHSMKNSGSLNVIVVPSFFDLNDTMYILIDEIIPKDCIESWNRTDRELKFKNGSKIIFRSGFSKRSIQRIHGMSISSFWIDEKSPIDKLIWYNLVGMLRQNGMSYLGIITSNIKDGWVHEKFYVNKDKLSNEFLIMDIYQTEGET